MKAAIISLNSTSSKWTAEAMRKYFKEVDELSVSDLEINISGRTAEAFYKGKPLSEYDCIYCKGSFRYAQLLRSLATIMQGKCYMPISPEAYTVAHDKLLTQLMLQQHNIPMPKTYISSTVKAAREILSNMNYPIIMKFPQGTQGKGVLFADSFGSASSILDALSELKQSFIIQEYIDTDSSDIRAIVVGDKVVGAMMRRGSPEEKRSNIHAGGVGEPIELDDASKETAVKAAKATGADICGVDMLESVKGPLVIETNISPGLQGVVKATKIDIADKIAKFLAEKTAGWLEKKKAKTSKDIMKDLRSSDNESNIITSLDYRGSRILLPEIVTKASGIKSADQVEIIINKDKVTLKKLDIS